MGRQRRNATNCPHTGRPEKARGLCGSCHNAWLAEHSPGHRARRLARFNRWKLENPEKYQAAQDKLKDRRSTYYRNSDLRRHFGMEPDQYHDLLDQQGGVCAICSQPETRKGRRYLAVDHCHTTGKIRGLLCANCNCAIGHFKDSTEILNNAIKYLEQRNGLRLPFSDKT